MKINFSDRIERPNDFKFAKICAHGEDQPTSVRFTNILMQKKLFWEAVSNEDRNNVINQIKDIVSKNSAYIINFNMFSDLALGLSIEVEENTIYELHSALCKLLTISDLTFENSHENGEEEWLIFLNVSFGKGEGALKVVVPEVPG